MAHGRVLTPNGTKNVGDRERIVFFPHGPQEQCPGRGSKLRRVLVVGRRVAANKGANGEDSGFSIAGEQLCSGEGERRKKKRKEVNGSEQGARVFLLQLEANAERPKGQSAKTQPTDPSTSADESQYGPVPSGGDD